MDFVVTTTRDNQDLLNVVAKQWSKLLHKKHVIRESWNLDKLLEENNVQAVLLATAKGPKVYTKGGTFFYHPSMALLRIQNLQQGKVDHLVEAMNLQAGMRVLDCTLGLATDAAVASYVVGKNGVVVGLETSELLHFVVQYGLKNYAAKDVELTTALRRIVAVHMDAELYLDTCKEIYDVVYFDPMFETPVDGSSNMKPLRSLACDKKITKTMVDKALKIAPRVVVKERYIKYLSDLGCTEFFGGKYSTIKYGVRKR